MGRSRSLISFFVLAYTLTWLCWLPIAAARAGWFRLPVPEDRLADLGQFGPLISALLFTLRERGTAGLKLLIRAALRWRMNPLWLLVALFFPPLSYLAALQFHSWWTTDPPVPLPKVTAEALLLTFPFVLVTGGPLGEEIGWRGFALPRLQQRWTPLLASLVLGVLWAGWHLPLWWIARVPTSFGWYLASMIPLCFVLTCVFNRSGGSILAAMLFHASLNTGFLHLPIALAYREWALLLWLVALALFAGRQDRPQVAPKRQDQGVLPSIGSW